MGSKSGIGWTDATWNPVTGCDRVSTGCDNCYALTLSAKLKIMNGRKYQIDGHPKTSGPGFGLTMYEEDLDLPRRWRKPRMVFVNSMSDIFHAKVTNEFLDKMFDVMEDTPRHTYQILTKRSARMRRYLFNRWAIDQSLPPPNIWMGVSVELSEWSHRVYDLSHTPVAVKFVSIEPMLGSMPTPVLDSIYANIDWFIVGAESGTNRRRFDPDWVRDVRDWCQANDKAFYFKQGSHFKPGQNRVLDGRTWDEFPEIPEIRELALV